MINAIKEKLMKPLVDFVLNIVNKELQRIEELVHTWIINETDSRDRFQESINRRYNMLETKVIEMMEAAKK